MILYQKFTEVFEEKNIFTMWDLLESLIDC